MKAESKLAAAFRTIIRREIPATDLVHIDTMNRDGYVGCATHEHIDANQAMLEAWEVAFGREPDLTDDDLDTMNTAWDIAIKTGYAEA